MCRDAARPGRCPDDANSSSGMPIHVMAWPQRPCPPFADASHVHRRVTQILGAFGARGDDRDRAVAFHAVVVQAQRIGDHARVEVLRRA